MIRKSSTYMAAFALPGILGLLNFAFYTRMMTSSEYAVYSISVSASYFVSSIFYSWIRIALARSQAEDPEAELMQASVLGLICITIVLCPTAATAVAIFAPEYTAIMTGIFAVIVCQAMFDLKQETLRSRGNAGSFMRYNLLRSILGSLLTVFIVMRYKSGIFLVYALALSFLVAALMSRGKKRIRFRYSVSDVQILKEFLFYGLPLAISGIVFTGNPTLSKIASGRVIGAEAVGHFSAGLDLVSQLAVVVSSAVTSVVAPMAFKAYSTNGAFGAKTELRFGVELFLAVLIPALVGLSIVSTSLSNLIMGDRYGAEVANLLPVLSLAIGINVFSQYYLHLGFQIARKPYRQIACGFASLSVNASLITFLGTSYGVYGCAISFLAGEIVGLLAAFALLQSVFIMPLPAVKIAKIGLSATGMTMACEFVGNHFYSVSYTNLISVVCSGVIVYVLFATILNVCNVRMALLVIFRNVFSFSR